MGGINQEPPMTRSTARCSLEIRASECNKLELVPHVVIGALCRGLYFMTCRPASGPEMGGSTTWWSTGEVISSGTPRMREKGRGSLYISLRTLILIAPLSLFLSLSLSLFLSLSPSLSLYLSKPIPLSLFFSLL